MIRGRGKVALVLGLFTACASASAGTLRGTVQFAPSGPSAGPVRSEDAVVWLEKVPENTDRDFALGRRHWFLGRRVGAPEHPRLIAKDMRFEPRVVAVAAGDSLVIRNEDRVWHGTFSVSPTRAFELGKRAPGSSDTLRFDQVGQIQVRCDIHPDMSATVVVTPNHAFTRPNAAGTWALTNLPPGSYVLRAWAPGLVEMRREVSVAPRGDTVVPLRW